jgi:hypothetical protein
MSGGKKIWGATEFGALARTSHAAAILARADAKTMPAAIGGVTFTPGTWKAAAAVGIAYNTVVTLDGEGEYLFQVGTSITTAAQTSFVLINGAKAEDVLWAVGASVTLGAGSVFEGSISAGAAITMADFSVIHGCVLAETAITFPEGGFVEPAGQIMPFLTGEAIDVSIGSKSAGTS